MKPKNIKILKEGGVGIIPTDTIYGIACSVFSESALLRLYALKGREQNKPPVVLIADIQDLKKFDANVSDKHIEFIKKYWPGRVTFVFEVSKKFEYLDRGLGLAVRLPADENLRKILAQTGPLATSSANIQGMPFAKNISEATRYFSDSVDFYEDRGELHASPSTLVDLRGGEIKILREGDTKIILD